MGFIKGQVDRQIVLLNDGQSWCPIARPINFPERVDDFDGGGYGEFVYFHDFVQNFLYPTNEEGAFTLFHRPDLKDLRAMVAKEEHCFKVERLTLHVFKLGICMMTLELRWAGQTGGPPLGSDLINPIASGAFH